MIITWMRVLIESRGYTRAQDDNPATPPCTCACIHTYACYICIHTYINVYIYAACVRVQIRCVHTYILMHTHTYIIIQSYIYKIHAYVYIPVCTHTNVCIQACMHTTSPPRIYAHVHTCLISILSICVTSLSRFKEGSCGKINLCKNNGRIK